MPESFFLIYAAAITKPININTVNKLLIILSIEANIMPTASNTNNIIISLPDKFYLCGMIL